MSELEFKKLLTIQDHIKGLKSIYMMVIGVLSFTILVVSLYFVSVINDMSKYNWIIDTTTGSVVGASSRGVVTSEERKLEYEGQVEEFYHLMFEFDQFNFYTNVNKGLDLVGNSGKLIINDYTNNRLIKTLQQENLVYKISIDSIIIDNSISPARGICFAKQNATNSNGSILRFYNAKFDLLDLDVRTKKNKRKVLLENFKFINRSIIPNSN